MIDKYDDRLVLRNPGTLRLPIEKIYEGGTSRARNPRIQNMLRMIGYGENLGSGFPMIVSAWKEAGWSEPVLENRIELDEVALTLPVEPIDLKKEKSTNGNKVENGSVEKTVEKTVEKIVMLIESNSNITIKEMAELLGLSRRGVEEQMKSLKSKGVIRRVGPDKGGHWEITKTDETGNLGGGS